MLNLNKIREACKEYEKWYDDHLPPSTWLLALVKELTQARAEIEKLQALVPPPELLERLDGYTQAYAAELWKSGERKWADAAKQHANELRALIQRINEAQANDESR